MLQVLGLTNYSRDPEAGTLRKCIREDEVAARLAVDYAKERLRTFTHVGTFEGMREHLSAYASKMGIDIDSPAYSSNKQHAFSYDSDPEDAEKVRAENPVAARVVCAHPPACSDSIPAQQRPMANFVTVLGAAGSSFRGEMPVLSCSPHAHVVFG